MHILSILFYTPIYNAFIFFIAILPGHNLAIAMILFSCLLKVVFFPMYQTSIKTQFAMKKLQPELDEIKKKYSDFRVVGEKTNELYKKHGVNPFSGILGSLLQVVFLITLTYVCVRSNLPTLDHTILYSFTLLPNTINTTLFGINVLGKNFFFGVIAAIAQFIQMQIMLPKLPPRKETDGAKPNFSDELSRSMNTQMKYVMPATYLFFGAMFPILACIFYITTSIFASLQELYVRKKLGYGSSGR